MQDDDVSGVMQMHRPRPSPQAGPGPLPMEAEEFLRVLLILSVVNSACTLARAFSFAFAGMAAARRTHEKLFGKWWELHQPRILL